MNGCHTDWEALAIIAVLFFVLAGARWVFVWLHRHNKGKRG